MSEDCPLTCGTCRHWKEAPPEWDAKKKEMVPGSWRWCADLVVVGERQSGYERGDVIDLETARQNYLQWNDHLRTREHFGCTRHEGIDSVSVDDDSDFWMVA